MRVSAWVVFCFVFRQDVFAAPWRDIDGFSTRGMGVSFRNARFHKNMDKCDGTRRKR